MGAIAHILVVDDDPMTIDICKTYLTASGYEITGVFTTAQAQASLEEKPADLVLLDVHMPNETGLVFLQRIRGDWPDLPVVLITGHPGIQTVVQAMKLNVVAYLVKPFPPSELRQTVEKALHEYAVDDQT